MKFLNKRDDFNNILFIIICLISLCLFSYYIIILDIFPKKYLIGGYIIIAILIFSSLVFMYFSGKKTFKIKGYYPIAIFSFILLYTTFYLHNTYYFLDNASSSQDNNLKYSVVTLKVNSYQQLEDLNGKKISYFDDDYSSNVKDQLEDVISYQEVLANNIGTLADNLLEKNVDALCVEDNSLDLIKEEVYGFDDRVKTVSQIEIKTNKENNLLRIDNITSKNQDQFILYISGIDQYGNVNSIIGRSDVNILAVVNMKTNHILLVNTPRDYYVQLAGTQGLKDKLTHAGIYGIEESVNTLENLYDINIDYYVKVNFNTLINVVDVVGGIDIYSDTSFGPIYRGWNHLNGEKALTYSRERHAYASGDNHRGANQQQVITAIINKITNSTVLISNYNHILSTLDGSFQTNMPRYRTTSFLRYQLDTMANWKIESIAVTGYNSMNYTYSMGTNYLLYVMEPNLDSIASAKKKINEILVERLV